MPAQQNTRPGCLATVLLAIAGMFAATFGMAMPPWPVVENGCGGGLLAALTVPAVDWCLLPATWYARRLWVSRFALVAISGVVAFAIGLALGIGGPEKAFREVFGVPAPPQVENLAGQRIYAGMFDPDTIVLRFRVDGPTLRDVLATNHFTRDDAELRTYAHQHAPSMKSPVLYRNRNTIVLWDAATNDVRVCRYPFDIDSQPASRPTSSPTGGGTRAQ